MSLFEENAAILKKMALDGRDITSPRSVDFCHVFPDKLSAEAFAHIVDAEGFAVLMYEGERKTDQWDLTASKEIAPTCQIITEIEEGLDRLARLHNGRADGWGFFNV